MKFTLVLFTLSLVACALGASPRQTRSAETGLFPAAKQPLTISVDAEGGASLSDVVRQFETATGLRAIVTAESRDMLSKTHTGLSRTLEVPASEVYSVVETILVQNGFALAHLRGGEPALVRVASLGERDVSALASAALSVPGSELEAWREHPAFVITTTLDLPHVDVRQVANSMRSQFKDARTQSLIPVGNSNSLIVTGYASQVVSLVRTLREIDESSRRFQEQQAKTPAPAAKEEAGAK